MIVLALAGCGEMAKLPISAGTGPQPTLPPPQHTLIPTVHIAPAQGWSSGAMPQSAPGTKVAAFASGLDHPRWLLVLANGDVLVAETNAPPKPEDAKGIKGWLTSLVMKRAGAGVPSANRITLLRAILSSPARNSSARSSSLPLMQHLRPCAPCASGAG